MSNAITDQLALRLGLAAKAAPQLGAKALINGLIKELGEPLTEKKLRKLNPKKLYQLLSALDRDIERGQSNQVFAILTSDEISTMQPPTLPENANVSGPKLRVAISANNDEKLDGHFGSCLRFLIYEANGSKWQLVDVRPVATDETGLSRTDYLVDLIKDCHMLTTLSIGGPAAAKVVRADITPIKKPQLISAADVLDDFNHMIGGTPPPWIAKILQAQESTHEC